MKIERLYGRRYDPDTEITITTGATEGAVRDADRAGASRRRGGAVPAGLRLLHAGRPVERRHPALRHAALSRLPHRLGRGAPRGHAAHARHRAQHAAQPDRDDVDRRRHARAGARAASTPTRSWSSDEVYEHIGSTAPGTRAWRAIPTSPSRAVVISSFGKTYHTTGWKVGYCAAPAPLVAEILRVHQWVTFAVNGAVQMAYADAVQRQPAAATTSPRSIRAGAICSCG